MELPELSQHFQKIITEEAESLASIAKMKSMQFAGFTKILDDQSQDLARIAKQSWYNADCTENSTDNLVASTVSCFEKRLVLLEKQTRILAFFKDIDDNDKALGLSFQGLSRHFKESVSHLQKHPPKCVSGFLDFVQSELKERYRRCKHLRKQYTDECEIVSFLFKLYSKVLRGLVRKVQDLVDRSSREESVQDLVKRGEGPKNSRQSAGSWNHNGNNATFSNTICEGSDLSTTGTATDLDISMLSVASFGHRRNRARFIPAFGKPVSDLDTSGHSVVTFDAARKPRPTLRRCGFFGGSLTSSSPPDKDRYSTSDPRRNALRARSLKSMTSVSSVTGHDQEFVTPTTVSTNDSRAENTSSLPDKDRYSTSNPRRNALRARSLKSMTSVSSVTGHDQEFVTPTTVSTNDSRAENNMLFNRRLDDVLSRSSNQCLFCTLARPGGKASKCICEY